MSLLSSRTRVSSTCHPSSLQLHNIPAKETLANSSTLIEGSAYTGYRQVHSHILYWRYAAGSLAVRRCARVHLERYIDGLPYRSFTVLKKFEHGWFSLSGGSFYSLHFVQVAGCTLLADIRKRRHLTINDSLSNRATRLWLARKNTGLDDLLALASVLRWHLLWGSSFHSGSCLPGIFLK